MLIQTPNLTMIHADNLRLTTIYFGLGLGCVRVRVKGGGETTMLGLSMKWMNGECILDNNRDYHYPQWLTYQAL